MNDASDSPRRFRPVVLCILDGWGHREERENNAIALAPTPVYDHLIADCPNSLINTSGDEVGLPAGQMGNSEVGHMNIGSGRVVLQMLPRIDQAIADGEFSQNPALARLIASLEESGGDCHLMGLVSPGGVHSHQDHFVELVRILGAAGIEVQIHAFLDGRDTPPRSADEFVAGLERDIGEKAQIATVSGRYYAMDRDRRYERTKKAWDAIVSGDGARAASASDAIQSSWDNDVSDEFVVPCVVGDYTGIADGDGIIMVNFRADRARQILTALVDDGFDGFERPRVPHLAAAAGMTEYSRELNAQLDTLFPADEVEDTLGEVVSALGLRQLRIAETEKYAHVTFFLNGGRETVFDGEERILIPSPKVATYDLKPEMSAAEVTNGLVDAIQSGTFDLCVVNFANPDMVGHTGDMAAAIAAVETIDGCLGRLEAATLAAGGALCITADHGNIELMQDRETSEPHTAHTTFVVPFIVAGTDIASLEAGRLADIAPTVLALMEIDKPRAMTGSSLIKRRTEAAGARERAR